MELEELKKELKLYLKDDEKRYNHCIGVMNMCEKLATKYNVDIEKAKKIGLMHDMAKDLSKSEKLEYVDINKIECSKNERLLVEILHGKIAADICKKKYDFDDEMCRAIAIHTTGDENMTMLQKILFVADKTDETRNYEDVEYYRKLAFKDIDEDIIEIINYVICNCTQKDKIIDEKSIRTRNFLLVKRMFPGEE